jgi:hypothetical protein
MSQPVKLIGKPETVLVIKNSPAKDDDQAAGRLGPR